LFKKLLVLVLLNLIFLNYTFSWGFYAHREINRIAIFSLPIEMFGFYKVHILEITQKATAPDVRRQMVQKEAPKHYIDLDHYEKEAPLDTIPFIWDDAVFEYTEDSLWEFGVAPWNVQWTFYQLVNAFRENNADNIVKYSADLGHYVADCHVPLHCTENYNGQLTNQKGIHAFWETRLPTLFDSSYNLFVGKAFYIENPLYHIWNVVEESFQAKDSVLNIEKQLSDSISDDLKYGYSINGNAVVQNYSEYYSGLFHKRLDGMVERRLRSSILVVSSLWYTAWVKAGKPLLDKANAVEENSENSNAKLNESEPDHWDRKNPPLKLKNVKN
jgi:uncharacterized protein YjaG (DUF416 family)